MRRKLLYRVKKMKTSVSCKVCVQWPLMFTFINFFYIDQPRLVKIKIYVYYFFSTKFLFVVEFALSATLSLCFQNRLLLIYQICILFTVVAQNKFSQKFFKTFIWNTWTLVKNPIKCGKIQLLVNLHYSKKS